MTNRIGRAEVVAPHGEAAETSGAGGYMGPPLRHIRRPSLFRRGRFQTGPREGQFPIPSVSLRSTSSLPLLAYGHFPLIGGIGPLIRGVVPSPTGFNDAFRGWVGEPLGAPVGGVRAKKSPSSVWPSGQPPSPWKGEGLSGRVWDPPLRRITKTVSRLRRGRSQTGPPGFAPRALAEKTQAQLWNRTGP